MRVSSFVFVGLIGSITEKPEERNFASNFRRVGGNEKSCLETLCFVWIDGRRHSRDKLMTYKLMDGKLMDGKLIDGKLTVHKHATRKSIGHMLVVRCVRLTSGQRNLKR